MSKKLYKDWEFITKQSFLLFRRGYQLSNREWATNKIKYTEIFDDERPLNEMNINTVLFKKKPEFKFK